MDHSFHGPFIPENESYVEHSFFGPFVPTDNDEVGYNRLSIHVVFK